jgi:hypothetical protein
MKILIESQNDLEISPVSCVSSIKNGSLTTEQRVFTVRFYALR